MAEKPGGIQDNGGVYLHPAAWKLASGLYIKEQWKGRGKPEEDASI